MKGVRAVPMASSRRPAASTRAGPCRSAMAPAKGCTAPQTNCPMAMAREMLTTPRPVAALSGATKSPWDCRAPMVTMRMAAATSVTTQ